MAVRITWYDTNAFEKGYRIYRNTTPFDGDTLPAPLADIEPDAAEFLDVNVIDGVTYYYRVAAIHGSDNRITLGSMVSVKAVIASVPGGTSLIGTLEDMGYLGVVEGTEMPTGTDLSTAANITNGTIYTNAPRWWKFYYYGKIIFIPVQPLRSNLDPRYLPDPFQYSRSGVVYDVRLMTNTEWNDLIYRVHEDNPTSEVWASFTKVETTIGTGTGSVSANWVTGAGTNGYRGYSSLTHQGTTPYGNGWRPALVVNAQTLHAPLPTSAVVVADYQMPLIAPYQPIAGVDHTDITLSEFYFTAPYSVVGGTEATPSEIENYHLPLA